MGELPHVLRLRAPLALHDVKLDTVTLAEGLDALGLNRRMAEAALLFPLTEHAILVRIRVLSDVLMVKTAPSP